MFRTILEFCWTSPEISGLELCALYDLAFSSSGRQTEVTRQKLAHNINMRASSITERAARPNIRNLRPQVRRSLPKAPKRRTRAQGYHFELPRNLRDRIILLMFTCCLFTFLHAFFGFSFVDEDVHALNDTFAYQRTRFSTSSPWSSVTSNENQKIRAQGTTRVMVDRYGNYELFPSTASTLVSPAPVPQDTSPDPTPVLVRAERRRARAEGSHSTATNVKTSVDTPFAFDRKLYDPSRLELEDSDEGSENHGLYPVAGPLRTALQGARPRRFGRCLPGEACF